MVPENQTLRCECGRRKQARSAACDRCLFLDGRTCGPWAVISALRHWSEPATLEEIATTGEISTRNAYRIIRELAESGRVTVVGRGRRGDPHRFALSDAGVRG